MINKVSLIFTVLSFIACSGLFSQIQKQVLIFGTTHRFDSSAANDFGNTISILKKFQPDIICTEFIDKNDTLSLKNYNEQRLVKSQKLKASLTGSRIDSMMQYRSMDIFTLDDQKKLDLGNLLFIEHDYINSFYLYYMINNTKNIYGETSGYDLCRSFLIDGEFQNIIFPLATGLGIKYLYSVDDQTNSNEFKTAYDSVFAELAAAGKLEEAMNIQFDMETQFKVHEKSGDLIKFLNSEEFRTRNESLFNLARNLDSKFAKEVIKYWDARNLNITKNIIDRIEAAVSQKTIVAIGSAHVSYIKSDLLKNSDYKVITFDEID